MIAKWKEHCPYDNEEHPGLRQAWRKGWFYRKEHGPVRSEEEITRRMEEIKRRMTIRLLFSSWLEGYFAAEEHLQQAKPEFRQ